MNERKLNIAAGEIEQQPAKKLAPSEMGMTVAQLRKALENHEDDLLVIVSLTNYTETYISGVSLVSDKDADEYVELNLL